MATVVETSPPRVATPRSRQRRHLKTPLLLVLATTAFWALMLNNGVFIDEALYIMTGRSYLDHWFSGAPLPPDIGVGFSGTPVLYPVLAGLVDLVGGLQAVRLLSLLCVLSTMLLIRSTTAYLFTERAGLVAAMIFGFTAPVIYVGHLGTFDATVILMLATALYLGVTRTSIRSAVAIGLLLAAAVATKYTAYVFVLPVMFLMLFSRYQLVRSQTLRLPRRPRMPELPRLRLTMSVLVREASKFGVIGAVAFVVDTATFNLFAYGLDVEPLRAKIVSVAVASLVAWVGNRYWTFRHRKRPAMFVELMLFISFNVVGLAISLGCLGLTHYVFGLTSPLADNVSANVIGLGLGMMFRFWAYREFVFNEPTKRPDHVVPTRRPVADPGRGMPLVDRARAVRVGITATVTLAVLGGGYLLLDQRATDALKFTTTQRHALSPVPASELAARVPGYAAPIFLMAFVGLFYLALSRRWLMALFGLAMIVTAFALPLAQMRLGEGVSFEKHLAYSALFLAPMAGWGLTRPWKSGLWTPVLVFLALLSLMWGAFRSNELVQYPDARPVAQTIGADPTPGEYLSSSAESLAYYTREDPRVKWYPTSSLYGQKQGTIARAVKTGRFQEIILHRGPTGSTIQDNGQQALLGALSKSDAYEKHLVGDEWVTFTRGSGS